MRKTILNIVDSEIDQSWSVIRIVKEQPPTTWERLFESSIAELEHISAMLQQEEEKHGEFFPLKKDLFATFYYTQLSKVKVVILGQDPYPQTIYINGKNVPRATGLSFSVRPEDSIPVSLKNIYKEIYESVTGFVVPDHGDLRSWARQGVLLLNTSLTLIPGKSNSHAGLWLDFINKVVKEIATVNPKCIYLLWGNDAKKLTSMVGEKSVILEASHPSGYSANRGFFGCNHFNLVNEHLLAQHKTPINWNLPPRSSLIGPNYL